MKKNIAVLFGGKSSEYEVSLSSAYALLSNIDEKKYNIYKIAITRDGKWLLYEGENDAIKRDSFLNDGTASPILFSPDNECCDDPHDSLSEVESGKIFVRRGEKIERIHIDAVFPMLHGKYGEDGQVQGMFSVMGIPVVGCGCASSAVSMDKAMTKSIINGTGIRQARAVVLRRLDAADDAIRNAEDDFGYPMFVKPARSGSSVGVSRVKERDELKRAIETAFREDDKILIEEAINGIETEVAVLEVQGQYTVSVPAEIDSGSSEFYDYETKYLNDSSSFYIPARIGQNKIDAAKDCALKIFRALDCRGMARVDFFFTPEGEFVFNEINTIPGFTPISMYPKLMIHEGISYSELIDKLIESC